MPYIPEILLNNIALMVIAICGAYGAYEARQARIAAAETKVVAEKTEVNTNSMREQLVKATASASHAAGVAEEFKRGEAKAAVLAEGMRQGESANKA